MKSVTAHIKVFLSPLKVLLLCFIKCFLGGFVAPYYMIDFEWYVCHSIWKDLDFTILFQTQSQLRNNTSKYLPIYFSFCSYLSLDRTKNQTVTIHFVMKIWGCFDEMDIHKMKLLKWGPIQIEVVHFAWLEFSKVRLPNWNKMEFYDLALMKLFTNSKVTLW